MRFKLEFTFDISDSSLLIDDVTEIRRSIGQGAYVCKLLAQKSYTNEDAVKLFHDKMKEICND